MIKEEFRLLPGFEDKVKVSNLGYAINLNYRNSGKERRFKLSKNSDGYFNFGFNYKGKTYIFGIHQAVAMAFIPNPNNFSKVNHKDENKENNCVDNLEWCTHVYNCRYSLGKPVACYDLNENIIKVYNSVSEVEEDGFCRQSVKDVCNNKCGRKTHPRGLYTWRFID